MWPELPQPWRDAVVTPLAGGMTNRHWLLATGAEQAVLRRDSDAVQLGIDRQGERQAWHCAARAGISPALLWQGEGWTLSRFINGASGPADSSARLGQLLSHIHWLQNQPLTLPVLPLRQRALALGAKDGPWAAYSLIESQPEALRPAHVDPNPGNYLWQGERLWLLDWEYASLADPDYDLAAIAVEHSLAAKTVLALWQQCSGEQRQVARLQAMMRIYAHLCECWCRHQATGYRKAAARYRKAWRTDLVDGQGVN